MAGIRVKALWEFLGGFNSRAFGMDCGACRSFDFLKLYKSTTPNTAVGISFYNLGSSIILYEEQESLPVSMQMGFSYAFFDDLKGTLLYANDYKYFFEESNARKILEINNGIEYSFRKYVSLRAGYIFSMPIDASSRTRIINNKYSYGLGIGFNLYGFRIKMEYSLLIPILNTKFYTHSKSINVCKLDFEEYYIK